MKKILFLTALFALTSVALTNAAPDPALKASTNITMKKGTFWPNHEVTGKTYYLGNWYNPEELPAQAKQAQYQGVWYDSTLAKGDNAFWRPHPTEQQALQLLNRSSLEDYAVWWGYATNTVDIEALLRDHTIEEIRAPWEEYIAQYPEYFNLDSLLETPLWSGDITPPRWT